MSISSTEDIVAEQMKEEERLQNDSNNADTQIQDDPIIRKVPKNLTPGRTNLRKWLSRSFRVVITDGRILIGIFNCTDKDANIVLAMCAEYLEEGGDARVLGNVMIPGKHIVSIEVDLLGQHQEIA